MDEKEEPSGPVGDGWSQRCWSANKRVDPVLRLLRGEQLDQLSRELEVELMALTGSRRGLMSSSSTASRD